MTTVESLLAGKLKLLERLNGNPGSKERKEIEGLLAQINTALGLLEEPRESKTRNSILCANVLRYRA
jgi:hypothetical protein